MSVIPVKWAVLCIVGLMYALVVIFPAKKSYAAFGAALLVVLLEAVSPLQALTELVNWSVLFIFAGSFLIAKCFAYSKVPAALALRIANKFPNAALAMVVIILITGLISAFVGNMAVILVMAPVAIALCAKLKIDCAYFVAFLAFMANLQGVAALTGSPASLIFGSFMSANVDGSFGFNDFFVHKGKPSIFFAVQLAMLAGLCFFLLFCPRGSAKKAKIEQEARLSFLPTALLLLMIAGLAVISFFFGGISILAGLWVMFLGSVGLVWYAMREGPKRALKLIKTLDWEAVLFLAGIFVVTGAILGTGILDDFARFIIVVTGGGALSSFVLIVSASVVICGFIDSVPYIAVMLPVVDKICAASGLQGEPMFFALLVGSCIGGNLAPFGSRTNIAAMSFINEERKRQGGKAMSFAQWLKIGAPFALVTAAAASLFIYIVWF